MPGDQQCGRLEAWRKGLFPHCRDGVRRLLGCAGRRREVRGSLQCGISIQPMSARVKLGHRADVRCMTALPESGRSSATLLCRGSAKSGRKFKRRSFNAGLVLSFLIWINT
jgi:hypothetical protein